MQRRIVRREIADPTASLLDRLLSARGLVDKQATDHSLAGLLQPDSMKDIRRAAEILADCVEQNASILIVGDFDADGATSCALMVSTLRAFGCNKVQYLVPDRFRFGYGLSPEIVEVARQFSPDLIVTVDNGISSVEGVALANRLGISVIVTDHHLPGTTLPDAAAIVNPNQPECRFASKSIAGVGVAFYLLSVLRRELRDRDWFKDKDVPTMADALDIVALGTVADVVSLDQNNRRLVEEGVRRIRAGRARPGLAALISAAGVDPRYLTTRDFAFSIAPRLNAAGRLQDMSIGIECLLAAEPTASTLATQLDALNRERREIEIGMRDEALALVEALSIDGAAAGLCLFEPHWHQGVVGIVASRVREKSERPVIAFATAENNELKGSGRSVAGFHLRDALDLIAKRHPDLLIRFGGHAMAAGLSLEKQNLARFSQAFDDVVREMLGEAVMEQVALTDGELGEAITINLAKALETAMPWGQGIPEPEFDDDFEVLEQRIVGGRHLKLLLQPITGAPVDAICFNHPGLLERRHIHCAYRIEVNRYRGLEKPQLIVTLIP